VLPVEIVPIQDSVVLRARGSELLILPHHVTELKGKKTPRDFTTYFTGEALINRPARKLFEAWLRKDNTLWPRLYKTIHEQMDGDKTADAPKAAGAGSATKPSPTKAKESEKPAAKSAKVAVVAKETAKPEKKPAKKSEEPAAKAAPKKAEPKVEKKAEKKPEKKTEKKAGKKPEKKTGKKADAKPAKKAGKK